MIDHEKKTKIIIKNHISNKTIVKQKLSKLISKYIDTWRGEKKTWLKQQGLYAAKKTLIPSKSNETVVINK